MTKRTYDPNLDNVYVRTPKGSPTSEILWDGETVGLVMKVEGGFGIPAGWKWRAEIGNAADPEAWPRYRASYGRTRRLAVADVLEGVEVPD